MAVLLVVMACCLCGCKKTVDLAEYVNVNYSGLNGFATASASLDEAWLEQAMAETKLSEMEQLSVYIQIEDGMQCTLDKASALSNGDKIKATIEYSDDLVKTVGSKLGIKLTGKSREFTVSGLEEGKVVDPFADLTVQFDGVGLIEVNMMNHSVDPFCKELTYRYAITQRVNEGTVYPEKGDVITVRPDMTQEQAMAQGYILKETEKTYTVENLCAYVTSADQIDLAKCEGLEEKLRTELLAGLEQEDTFNHLIGNALNDHPERSNDTWYWSSKKQEHGELVPVTAYFYCPVEPNAEKWKSGECGKIGYVYKTTVNTDEFIDQFVYLCSEAKPLYIREDGTFSWGRQESTCLALGYDEAGYRKAMQDRCDGGWFSKGYTLDLLPTDGSPTA